MGKKRIKVRWTNIVENDTGFFSEDIENYPPEVYYPQQQQQQQHHNYNNRSSMTSPGSSNDGSLKQSYNYNYENNGYRRRWSQAPLAPRFERKAAAAAAASLSPTSETVIYDGEICETEDLPNGFTKIRSKNLDVLFKKDYYATKNAALANANANAANLVVHSVGNEESEEASVKDEASSETEEPEDKKFDDEQKSDKVLNSNLNGSSRPFYPVNYNYMQQHTTGRLYLYSPSSNTMIPCEEFIISNPPVVGPDGNPIYGGNPNNQSVYLAAPPYPMESANSNFMVHYGVPYYPYPRTEYYSSDGCSSVESMTPQSPPDLSAHSPANWVADPNVYVNNQPNAAPFQPYFPAAAEVKEVKKEEKTIPVIPGLPPVKKITKKKRKKRLDLRGSSEGLEDSSPSNSPAKYAIPTEELKEEVAEEVIEINTESQINETAVNTEREHVPEAEKAEEEEVAQHVKKTKSTEDFEVPPAPSTPVPDISSLKRRNSKKKPKNKKLLPQNSSSSCCASSETSASASSSTSRTNTCPPSPLKMLYSSVVGHKSAELPEESSKDETITPDPELEVAIKESLEELNENVNKRLMDSEWRESSRRKSKRSRHNKHKINTQDVQDIQPVEQEVHVPEVIQPEPEVPEVPEVVEDVLTVEQVPVEAEVEAEIAGEEECSKSLPTSNSNSKRSTLKKRKKRTSLEDKTSSTTKPVLIQDGAIEIGGYRRIKRASEILDGYQIDQAVRKGHLDTLFISDIGTGIIDKGPMASGRLRVGKYNPPDRSQEIQKLINQEEEEEILDGEEVKSDLALD